MYKGNFNTGPELLIYTVQRDRNYVSWMFDV